MDIVCCVLQKVPKSFNVTSNGQISKSCLLVMFIIVSIETVMEEVRNGSKDIQGLSQLFQMLKKNIVLFIKT